MKMTDMKMQDMKMTDQVARHENAGHENVGHENDGPIAGHKIATETKIMKQKFSLNCRSYFHNA